MDELQTYRFRLNKDGHDLGLFPVRAVSEEDAWEKILAQLAEEGPAYSTIDFDSVVPV